VFYTYLGNRSKNIITEVNKMANTKSSKSMEVPEAKAAMDRFKTEVASELGVNLKEGYNGDLTSKEAGSIGGEMVRRMVKNYEESQLR
jgi:small, acid-soluble spore proteins, alpha/beta type